MIKYLVIYEKTETGFSAYLPDLPGCVATGEQVNYFFLESIRQQRETCN